MDAWKTEFDRFSLHRQILTDKLALPSNPATKRSLGKQLDRVELFIRRANGETKEEAEINRTVRLTGESIGIKKRRTKDRARLRDAKLCNDDGYAECLTERIGRQTERLHDIKDELELDPAILRRLRKPPTAEDAKKGIEVALKYTRLAIDAARIRGDLARVEKETARIGRLEGMIAALPVVPA